jgi:hypothetical protein
VLAGVEQAGDLGGLRELRGGDASDPGGALADDGELADAGLLMTPGDVAASYDSPDGSRAAPSSSRQRLTSLVRGPAPPGPRTSSLCSRRQHPGNDRRGAGRLIAKAGNVSVPVPEAKR